jgi:hypothetical protein
MTTPRQSSPFSGRIRPGSSTPPSAPPSAGDLVAVQADGSTATWRSMPTKVVRSALPCLGGVARRTALDEDGFDGGDRAWRRMCREAGADDVAARQATALPAGGRANSLGARPLAASPAWSPLPARVAFCSPWAPCIPGCSRAARGGWGRCARARASERAAATRGRLQDVAVAGDLGVAAGDEHEQPRPGAGTFDRWARWSAPGRRSRRP